MTIELLEQENLDRIRLMFDEVGARILGEGYQPLANALFRAEEAIKRPVILFHKLGDGLFAVGMQDAPLTRIRQRTGFNNLDELYRVLAATGQPVTLPSSTRAVRGRLGGAVEQITKEVGSTMIGNILTDGLHVGKHGARFDYEGVATIITG